MPITIDDAIVIQTALVNHGTEILSTPEIYAAKLSLEAMKRLKACRREYGCPLIDPEGDSPVLLLPGETEEVKK